MLFAQQRTIAHSISCIGTGLHSGERVALRLLPAPVDSGICFVRTDIHSGDPSVPARFDYVSDTMLGTSLTNPDGVRVATVEHLMAALCGLGIDNVRVELDGPEVPIMDGSSQPFIFLIECAGIKEQPAWRRYLRVTEPVSVAMGDSQATLLPHDGFAMNVAIEYDSPVIARQQREVDFDRTSFKASLGRARTFGFARDVEQLQASGLARGGSLDNAIVIDDDTILNESGLRYDDEFVRHKMLDCLGDLYLAGAQILGRFEGYRTGHSINNQLLHALLEMGDYTEPVSAVEPPAELSALFANQQNLSEPARDLRA